MKEGVLAYLYGQSAKAFARRMKVDESTGERFFAGMESSFPGLVALRASVIPALLRHGNIAHVETLYGRKRRFPDYRKNKAELDRLDKLPWKQRKADPAIDERRNWLWKYCAAVERQYINTMIQGTAADVIKMNMIALYERWVVGRGYKLHASIHDEVIPSVPIADLTPELIAELDDIMTKTVELAVPLKSDIVIMERWADEIKPDGWDFERGRPKLTAQEA
jgi:DNA polymerase-1